MHLQIVQIMDVIALRICKQGASHFITNIYVSSLTRIVR
jgi:hypothetical protein